MAVLLDRIGEARFRRGRLISFFCGGEWLPQFKNEASAKRLMFLAFLAVVGGFLNLGQFGKIPADLFFDQFNERDVRSAQAGRIADQWPADGAATGIELAHAARDEINQNVGVANLLQCFFSQFSFQNVFCIPSLKSSRLE